MSDIKLSAFDTTADKLSQLRSLIVVLEQAGFSSLDNRTQESCLWLMLNLAGECEELLEKAEQESSNKIKKLEQRIQEQQKQLNTLSENAKKAGGGS